MPTKCAKKRGNPGLKGKLVEKSLEGYILSLEIINRLSAKYRLESFAYLLCNAWELMLKAHLLTLANGDKRKIHYPKKRGERARSLSLRDCAKQAFPNENDAMRRNIERLADIRDEATHLIIAQIPRKVLGLLQASVRNYHSKLGDWFGISISDRVPVGMMTLVYDLDPAELDLSSAKLKRELGAESARYLMAFEAGLQEEFNALGRPSEFSIDINYRIALTQKPGEGDIELTKGASSGDKVKIVEVPKDPAKSHPHRQIDVRKLFEQRTGKTLSAYQMECIRRVHGVDKRPEHFYRSGVIRTPQFSATLVDWLVEQHAKDAGFASKACDKDKESAK